MKMMTKELVRLEERNAVYEVSGNRKEFGSGGRISEFASRKRHRFLTMMDSC